VFGRSRTNPRGDQWLREIFIIQTDTERGREETQGETEMRKMGREKKKC
jgi:hypothetical protein